MSNLVAPWVRRFLVQYLIGERNYTPDTQHSYRDTFRLFLPFTARQCRCGRGGTRGRARRGLTRISSDLQRSGANSAASRSGVPSMRCSVG